MSASNGFSPAPVPGARARLALLALGLLAVTGARVLVPRVAGLASWGPAGFYVVGALAGLALAAVVLLVSRRLGVPAGRGRESLYGLLAGAAAYLAVLAVGGFAGLLGSSTGGLPGRLLAGAYMLASGLAVAAGLLAAGRGAAPGDPGSGASAAGLLLAGVNGGLALAGGTELPAVLAVAAASAAVGGAVYLAGDRLGAVGGGLFLGVYQALILAGPWSLGGGFIVSSLIVALGAVVGWAAGVASLDLESLSLPRPERGAARKAAAAAIAVAAVAGAAAYLYSQDVVFWRPYVIVTGSMEPALNRGDMVLLERVEPGEIRVGDVVTFTHQGVPVTHRVIEVLPDGSLRTKGDANEAPDPYTVSPDQVIGRVRYRIPLLGWIVIALNWSPAVRMAAILAITGALIALALTGGEKNPGGGRGEEGDERTTVDRGG